MNLLRYLTGGKQNYKWETFEHNGVLFPVKYKPHNIPIGYQGNEIKLDKLAEEYATMYARYTDTEYITNRTFKKNFWLDWKKILGTEHKIKNLDGCDFTSIYQHILKEKEKKKELTKEQKEVRYFIKKLIRLCHFTCVISNIFFFFIFYISNSVIRYCSFFYQIFLCFIHITAQCI